MALELRQSLKLSQQLVMTPQLQQAIKLLQLSRLELQQAVREELEVNPALEEDMEGGSEAQGEAEPQTETEASPSQAERDASETPAETPSKELIDRVDWDYYFGDGATAGGTRRETDREEEDGRPYYENLLTRKPSLSEYLESQISLSDADDEVREIAPYLIGNIDENGYLKVSAEETADALGKPIEEVERAIAKIQTLDPAGIGARDLRECLMIQAREKGEEFSLPLQILTDHFDLFTRGDIAGIAKRLKLPREIVREACKKLVTLWPKPGRLFSGDDVHYITPDAYVAQVDNQWVVTLNEDGQPRLRLSSYYRDLISAGDRLAKEDKDFIKQKINSALWFIKSIQQRQRTIYKVVESIMKLQKDFLEAGPKHLKPLTLRDVAEDISMHESTVSRVTNSKYVCTPHGIFELKFFFNSGLNRDGGGGGMGSKGGRGKIRGGINILPKRVKEKTREPTKAGGGDHPLSDQDLARPPRNRGTRIPRRTVT